MDQVLCSQPGKRPFLIAGWEWQTIAMRSGYIQEKSLPAFVSAAMKRQIWRGRDLIRLRAAVWTGRQTYKRI